MLQVAQFWRAKRNSFLGKIDLNSNFSIGRILFSIHFAKQDSFIELETPKFVKCWK